MKKFFLTILSLICFAAVSSAETRWYNPMNAGFPVVQNQGWTEDIGNSYVRLPERAKGEVRTPVWELSRHSAGLSIHFYTNSPEITIRYGVRGPLSMDHMAATGVSGVDLYSVDSNGGWHVCSGTFSFKDTIQYVYRNIEKSPFHEYGYEYRLFLPLYNGVTWMEIGVEEGSELRFIPLRREKPILLYGTSIAHGACASRPGMAWGNILQRKLDYPLINLGFSGNGRLEKELLNYINEIDARLYILDCLPNLVNDSPEDVYRLTCDAVRQIRSKSDAPILLVEHIGYSNMATDSFERGRFQRTNPASKRAYETLLSEYMQNIYYITREELAIPADGWVDSIHPSDLGMQAQADAIEKKVREILHIPIGDKGTTIPVTQRREPYKYEWGKRHQALLALNQENPPRSVIIGNSITHFWGGVPVDTHKEGLESWNDVMEKAGFRNLGCGWDRVENVLWRVYHDILDGYQAEKVVLMIGTNNLGGSKNEDILEGLKLLLSIIRERQPQAKLKMIGILPRRGGEELVKQFNYLLQEMVMQEGYIYADPGVNLLLPDGKIDETLFWDGLHPNEKGYWKIVNQIVE